MSAPLRVAGRGRAGDGDVVTWSVAEGRRGRRWREVRVGSSGIVHSLLLEMAPDGRFAHLELSTPAGLATLHPEPDGTLHGNVVGAAGVAPIAGLAWVPDGLILIDRSEVALAASAALMDGDGREAVDRSAIVVTATLEISVVSMSAHRRGAMWTVAAAPGLAGPARELRLEIELDADGLPILADGETWPLE